MAGAELGPRAVKKVAGRYWRAEVGRQWQERLQRSDSSRIMVALRSASDMMLRLISRVTT